MSRINRATCSQQRGRVLVLLASMALTPLVLSACSEEAEAPPVVEADNIYQASVIDPRRPEGDRKQDEKRQPEQVLAFTGAKAGDVVADISASDGYYTELLARVVGGSGLVYLHNTPSKAQKIADKLEARLAEGRLSNVTRIETLLSALKLPEPVDLMVLSKIYHDLYLGGEGGQLKAATLLSAMRRQLNPGGRVLLIDHAAPDGSGFDATRKTHRIAEDFVVAEFEQAGFKLVDTLAVLRNPDDDRTINIWKPPVRNKTDRFVLLFEVAAE